MKDSWLKVQKNNKIPTKTGNRNLSFIYFFNFLTTQKNLNEGNQKARFCQLILFNLPLNSLKHKNNLLNLYYFLSNVKLPNLTEILTYPKGANKLVGNKKLVT